MVTEAVAGPAPLSLLDAPPDDEGFAGAKLAINDNNTTGRFLKQEFALTQIKSGDRERLIAEVEQKAADGAEYFVLDVRAGTAVALSDRLKGRKALLFDAGAPDDLPCAKRSAAPTSFTPRRAGRC